MLYRKPFFQTRLTLVLLSFYLCSLFYVLRVSSSSQLITQTVQPPPIPSKKSLTAVPKEGFDIVYTWVNGSDPEFLRRRSLYDHRTYTERWSDHDELKFSLRSLEKYFPHFRYIYIITDRQVPRWLNEKNPRVKVVYHDQLCGSDLCPFLPFFNSQPIELLLHRIAEIHPLTDNFIYLNDDMFFGARTQPASFLSDIVKVIWDNGTPWRLWRKYDLSILLSVRSTLQRLSFPRPFRYRYPSHVPRVLNVDLCKYVAHVFKEELLVTAAARFRRRNSFDFLYIYSISLLSLIDSDGSPIAEVAPPFSPYLALRCSGVDKLIKYVKEEKPMVFNINDEMTGHCPEVVKRYDKFMLSFYPKKSQFER
ncbi:hypothetical protein RCL1_000547 [Eukaryota sp. TZLM3-RCL]